MDTKGEIQLQQQINKIRTEIAQQQQESKKFYYDIMSILYSNTNLDEFGNKQLNPAINSSSKFIRHGDTSEQVLNFSRRTDWWQSLTYPNEYVQLQGNIVKQRFDYSKQLYADFDYRFCPVRQVDQTDFQEIFDKKKQSLTNLNQQVFGITLDKIQIGMTEELYQLTKTRIQNLFDYLTILIESSPEQQTLFINPSKYMITTLDQLNDILTQAQILNQLLELSQLTFPDKKYLIDPVNYTSLMNIFQGAVQNVHITNSQQVFLDPNGSFKNIYIQNANNIQLFGNSNININNSSNIILGNSTEQGLVDLMGVNRFYTEDSFCSNNGQFMYYNELVDEDDKHFCIMKRDTLKSARIIFSEVHNSDILVRGLSFNYSQGTISNLIRSQVMCELASCRYCDVFIQKSFIDGYLHLNKYSCVNGELIIGPNSFNTQGNQVGILSFKASQYLSDQQTQSLTCPGGLQMFYMNKEFKELKLLKGESNIIVQNGIAVVDGTKLMYDNGPFNLPQIAYHCKENQYLSTQTPQTKILTDGLISSWYGYYATNLQQQQFDNWNQLPLSQQEIIEDSITLVSGTEIKDYVIQQKQYNNGLLNLIVDSPAQFTGVEKIQLTINQTVHIIKVNGQDLSFRNCEYDIYIEDVSELQLSVDSLCKSIKIREDGNVTSLILSTGVDSKSNLMMVDILPDLIEKITPSNYMFYGCTKFNPIDFVSKLQQYSVGLFKEVDFRSYTTESFTFNMNTIPAQCFQASIWSITNFIFNTTTFDDHCFKQSSGPRSVQFINSINNSGKDQFQNCQTIQYINIDSHTPIPQEMFLGCDQLQSIQGLGRITSVGPTSFQNCHMLYMVDLSQCVSIGPYAFYGTLFGQLNLPNTQIIEQSAFSNCTSLQSVTLYANSFNKVFTDFVFGGCSELQTITIINDQTNDDYIVDVHQGSFVDCRLLNNISIFGSGGFTPKLKFNVKGNFAFSNTNFSSININNITGAWGIFMDINKNIEIYFYQTDDYTGGFEKMTDLIAHVDIYVLDSNVRSQLAYAIETQPQFYNTYKIQLHSQ